MIVSLVKAPIKAITPTTAPLTSEKESAIRPVAQTAIIRATEAKAMAPVLRLASSCPRVYAAAVSLMPTEASIIEQV